MSDTTKSRQDQAIPKNPLIGDDPSESLHNAGTVLGMLQDIALDLKLEENPASGEALYLLMRVVGDAVHYEAERTG
jgi:hypothetical protein